MLSHKLSDKQFIAYKILSVRTDPKAVRRMALYVLIRFMYGGLGGYPVEARMAQRTLVKSFKNVI